MRRRGRFIPVSAVAEHYVTMTTLQAETAGSVVARANMIRRPESTDPVTVAQNSIIGLSRKAPIGRRRVFAIRGASLPMGWAPGKNSPEARPLSTLCTVRTNEATENGMHNGIHCRIVANSHVLASSIHFRVPGLEYEQFWKYRVKYCTSFDGEAIYFALAVFDDACPRTRR